MSQRAFQRIAVGERIYDFEIMAYQDIGHNKRPLAILHSIEFPIPPSERFCELMWRHGLQVIFIRRAGYGKSSPLPRALINQRSIKHGATVAAEAVMLKQLFVKLGLEDVVLLAMGSSNAVTFRLMQMAPEISFTILANPVFNQDIWQVFKPPWFAKMLRQVITSKSGLHVAAQGIKLMIRKDPVSFYRHIMQGHPEDTAYIDANPQDYEEAGRFLLETDASLLYYDALMSLLPDPILKDGFFDALDAVILIGAHSTEYWQTQMVDEAARLGLKIELAPHGDLFCAYASPEKILELIENQSGRQTISELCTLACVEIYHRGTPTPAPKKSKSRDSTTAAGCNPFRIV